MRVLVVDDDRAVRDSLRRSLEFNDFEVVTASDGAEALAVIGNVGAIEQRSFTAIGDTTNLAARLQTVAEPGRVVIGATTAAELPGAMLEPLGPLDLKGKSEPVQAFLLERLG